MVQFSILVSLLCFVNIQHFTKAWMSLPAATVRTIRISSPATAATRTHHRTSSLAPTQARFVALSSQVKEAEITTKDHVNLETVTANVKGGESVKSLLTKYGVAYLATSISLSIVSMSLCYFWVSKGVDVGALLAKIGISSARGGAKKAGTFAIAYAAHKAASPIRFPPTVILSRFTAKLIGKKSEVQETGIV